MSKLPIAQVVDWATLGEVVVYSALAGVGLCVAFSLAILGATRFVDKNRDGRPLEAGFYAVLMTAGLLATLGALVLGFVVMTSKG